jgi:hypothetical protein
MRGTISPPSQRLDIWRRCEGRPPARDNLAVFTSGGDARDDLPVFTSGGDARDDLLVVVKIL